MANTQFTPTTYDFLKQNTFRFTVKDLPFISYTCQAVSLPSVGFGATKQATTLFDANLPGEKLSFGDFGLTFIVSEDLENYLELLNWMQGMASPKNYNNRKAFFRERADKRIDSSNYNNLQYSTGTLIITNAANIPVKGITFYEMFPIQLSNIDFNTTVQSLQYSTCTVTFKYNTFEFHSV